VWWPSKLARQAPGTASTGPAPATPVPVYSEPEIDR